MTLWVVKGGRSGERLERFLDRSVIGVGWDAVPDLSQFSTREALKDAYREAYPGESEVKVGVQAGQLWSFSHAMKDGDLVVVPIKTRGKVAVGRIAGPYRHTMEFGADMQHCRQVKWLRTDYPRTAFDKDLLSLIRLIPRSQQGFAQQRRVASRSDGGRQAAILAPAGTLRSARHGGSQ